MVDLSYLHKLQQNTVQTEETILLEINNFLSKSPEENIIKFNINTIKTAFSLHSHQISQLIKEILNKEEKRFDPSHYVYDESFVRILNNLSNNIKTMNKSHKASLEIIKNKCETVNDTLSLIKNSISDIKFQYKTLFISPSIKYSQKTPNDDKDFIKERLNDIQTNVNSIEDCFINIKKQNSVIEKENFNFFNVSKNIFKEMKELRFEKTNEIKQKTNFKNCFKKEVSLDIICKNLGGINSRKMDSNVNNRSQLENEIYQLKIENQRLHESIKNYQNNLKSYSLEKIKKGNYSSSNEFINMKSNNIRQIRNETNISQRNENSNKRPNTSIDFYKEKNEVASKKLNQINQYSILKRNDNLDSNHIKEDKKYLELCEMIVEFVNSLNFVQTAIKNKSSSVNELKRNFDEKRQRIYKLSLNYIMNSQINQNSEKKDNSESNVIHHTISSNITSPLLIPKVLIKDINSIKKSKNQPFEIKKEMVMSLFYPNERQKVIFKQNVNREIPFEIFSNCFEFKSYKIDNTLQISQISIVSLIEHLNNILKEETDNRISQNNEITFSNVFSNLKIIIKDIKEESESIIEEIKSKYQEKIENTKNQMNLLIKELNSQLGNYKLESEKMNIYYIKAKEEAEIIEKENVELRKNNEKNIKLYSDYKSEKEEEIIKKNDLINKLMSDYKNMEKEINNQKDITIQLNTEKQKNVIFENELNLKINEIKKLNKEILNRDQIISITNEKIKSLEEIICIKTNSFNELVSGIKNEKVKNFEEEKEKLNEKVNLLSNEIVLLKKQINDLIIENDKLCKVNKDINIIEKNKIDTENRNQQLKNEIELLNENIRQIKKEYEHNNELNTIKLIENRNAIDTLNKIIEEKEERKYNKIEFSISNFSFLYLISKKEIRLILNTFTIEYLSNNKINVNSNKITDDKISNLIEENVKLKSEVKDLINAHESIIDNLTKREEELERVKRNYEKLKSEGQSRKVSIQDDSNHIPIENYKRLLENLVNEENKYNALIKKYENLKKDYDTLKLTFEHLADKFEKGDQSIINKQNENDKILDFDDEEFLNIFKNQKIEEESPVENIKTTIVKENKQKQSGIDIKSLYTDRKDRLFSEYEDTISKFEENEKNLQEQLVFLKDEIRNLRKEVEMYKKMYNESISLEGKNSNLIEIIKNAFENLIFEVSLNTKAKGYAKIIMNILSISEEEQKRIINKKKKIK